MPDFNLSHKIPTVLSVIVCYLRQTYSVHTIQKNVVWLFVDICNLINNTLRTYFVLYLPQRTKKLQALNSPEKKTDLTELTLWPDSKVKKGS